ncbi:hypothetical protein BN2475_50054 [Paraburkholderia ribeironis]|uniref:Uncharacterized protein n=1 Tax=Paraburkholderia ribeironis TaxID=1247936 RepID=A0A1N7RK72_9BURK|nr:hypothetical protein BN2475_50054 [Paraburkholderia ribeironis]
MSAEICADLDRGSNYWRLLAVWDAAKYRKQRVGSKEEFRQSARGCIPLNSEVLTSAN